MLNSALVSLEDTIVAISTAQGPAAIVVIRLSGSLACKIIREIFQPARKPAKEDWLQTHKAVLGNLKRPERGEIIDQVVVTPYLAPMSYTGDDLIEISAHGSQIVARQILSLCTDLGARHARPGEFTERAFLAGKLDLTQAEAVLDLIQAKTVKQSRQAISALSGDIGRHIREVRQRLLLLLSSIVAAIDFPDEMPELPPTNMEEIISDSMRLLKRLASTARSGKYLREGLRLAIVGRPNVGKSSLLNQLLQIERAIVTDIPGTTRDSLEELIDINGIPVILIDTAGIRDTTDKVESIGIERTKQAISSADLILLLEDITKGWGEEEDVILPLIDTKPWLHVLNKIDLLESKAQLELSAKLPNKLSSPYANVLIAAKSGQGVETLCEAIEQWATGDGAGLDLGVSLNERQAVLCDQALKALALVSETIEKGLPQDCLATDLKQAIDCLSEMCGELVSEELISLVFANFCIGK